MNQKVLHKNNINLIIIGIGLQNAISQVARDTQADEKKIFVDPSRKLYQILDLNEAAGTSTISGKTENSKKIGLCKVISGLCWYLWKQISRGSQGNVYQMGATYFVDEKGNIIF